MTMFENLVVMFSFACLVVAILNFNNQNNNQKK